MTEWWGSGWSPEAGWLRFPLRGERTRTVPTARADMSSGRVRTVLSRSEWERACSRTTTLMIPARRMTRSGPGFPTGWTEKRRSAAVSSQRGTGGGSGGGLAPPRRGTRRGWCRGLEAQSCPGPLAPKGSAYLRAKRHAGHVLAGAGRWRRGCRGRGIRRGNGATRVPVRAAGRPDLRRSLTRCSVGIRGEFNRDSRGGEAQEVRTMVAAVIMSPVDYGSAADRVPGGSGEPALGDR